MEQSPKHGIKDLFLGNTYDLQKSAMFVALSDSPTTSSSSTPTSPLAAKENFLRKNQDDQKPGSSDKKLVRKRDRFFRKSEDEIPKATFYVRQPSDPVVPVDTNRTSMESAKSEVHPMSESELAFLARICSIEGNEELQAKLKYALHNWIGKRVSISNSSIEVFVKSVLGRECGLEIEEIEGCLPSYDAHPHLKFSVEDLDLKKLKKSEKMSLRFSVNDGQTSPLFRLDDLKCQKIFYGHVDDDKLVIDLMLAGKPVAQAVVTLKEIQNTNGEKVGWILRSPATNGERDQEVGTISLEFEFVHPDAPTPTTCLNKELFKDFHSDFFGNASDNATYDYDSGSNNLDYYVEVIETKMDDSSNMFLKSSKVVQNRSKIRYNRLKVVPDAKEGKSFCKIGSLTEDKITIKLYRIDSRTPTTARRILRFGESEDVQDVPETSPVATGVGDFDFFKNSFGVLTSKFNEAFSPNSSGSVDKSSSENVKKKMDMVYYEKILQVSDIPWNEGMSFSHGEYSWTLRIVGGTFEDNCLRPFLSREDTENLFLISCYRTLCPITKPNWSGNLLRSLRTAVDCLKPCALSDDWRQAKSKAIFMIHQDIFPDLNAQILHNNLPALNDPDLIDSFHNFCLQTIAKFDARDKPKTKQISYIVESLSTMYSTDGKYHLADIRSDLMSPIMAYVEKVLIKDVENVVVAALNFPSQQLLHLQGRVLEFCDATLKSVAENFGNFGLMTWCPLLAKICLEVGILKFENIHHEFERSGESTLLKKSLEFYENAFVVFNQFRSIGRFMSSIDHLFDAFEFCLTHWATCAAAKAEEQVARVLDMEREKHKPKDSTVNEPKSHRSPRKFYSDLKKGHLLTRAPVAPQISDQSTTSTAATTTSTLGNRDSWFSTDEEFLEWSESAVNVNGIFRSCDVSWHRLQWPDANKSITKFGSPLFYKLHSVFKKYIDGMRQIVMMDNEFDKHELVLILNSCYHSMKYLDNFCDSLGREVQRVADQMTDDDNGEIRKEIQFVQERFADAKFEAEGTVEQILNAFCEGQRKHFQHFIKARRMSDVSSPQIDLDDEESSSSISAETNDLLAYLDHLLFFFNQNLSVGLQNEKLAKKYNQKLKVKLFGIHDNEVEKFFEEADAIYEKSHDPKVFGDLNESLEIANAFRHNVSLKGNDKLDDIRMKLSIKGSHSADLIGTYLSDILELKKGLSKAYEENLGEVTFLAGLEDSKLYVHLKGVRNLRPRPNREDCNFRLTVSVLPLKMTDTDNYKISNKTLVYPQRKDHLFDVFEDDDTNVVETSNFNFIFDLSEFWNMRRKSKTFLEINFFDLSQTKTNMIFRGNVLVQLSEIPTIDSESDLDENQDCRHQEVFTRIPSLYDENSPAKESWLELTKRRDDLSKSFVDLQEKFRREKRIPVLPRSDEWVHQSGSGSSRIAPAAKCLFPSLF